MACIGDCLIFLCLFGLLPVIITIESAAFVFLHKYIINTKGPASYKSFIMPYDTWTH